MQTSTTSLGARPLPEPSARKWRRNERRLATVLFLIAVLALTLICLVSVETLSAIRAISAAENTYEKYRRNAGNALRAYVQTRDEQRYLAYTEAMRVSDSAIQAHAELSSGSPDYRFVRASLATALVPADDVLSILAFYRVLGHGALAADIASAWQRTGAHLLALHVLGEGARSHYGASPDAQPEPDLARLDTLVDQLDAEELRFTRRLDEASHHVERTLLASALVLGMATAAFGVLFSRAMWARLAHSQRAVEEGNARWELAAKVGAFGLLKWESRTDLVTLDARACEIWDLPPSASGGVPGLTLRKKVHPEDRTKVARAGTAAEHDIAIVERIRIHLEDEGIRYLEVSGKATHSRKGNPDGVVALVRDVTQEEEHLIEKLEEDAAERAYLAKREFLSRVSHELRTPLNAVIGFTELMRTDVADPPSPGQRARLERVLDGGQYLLRLVNDLLDAAKVEAGELSVVLRPVVLSKVMNAALELMQPARSARGVSFEVSAIDPLLEVRADAVRLRQVFMNLLSNAIKYSRPQGKVSVSCLDDGREVHVAIVDRGVGMTSRQQSELFIPFRRPAAGSHRTEGAGLGLVITKHLVERQGGRLEISSEAHRGTQVVVHLLREGAEDAPDFAESARVDFSHATLAPGHGLVLYIEDDPVNALLVAQYMTVFPGVQLVVAETGGRGLELARSLLPSLILLDMQLPDISGLQVLDELKADAGTCELLVVALSADAMPEQVEAALRRGAADYWTKPLQLAEFRSKLSKALWPATFPG